MKDFKTSAFRVVQMRVPSHMFRSMLTQADGLVRMKGLLVITAIGTGLRAALDKGGYVFDVRQLPDANDFIAEYLEVLLSTVLHELDPGEMYSYREMKEFIPRDNYHIPGLPIVLSAEKTLLLALFEGISDFQLSQEVHLDRLVAALDPLMDVIEDTTHKLFAHLEVLKEAE